MLLYIQVCMTHGASITVAAADVINVAFIITLFLLFYLPIHLQLVLLYESVSFD